MNKQFRIKSVLDNGYHDGYGRFGGVAFAESYGSEDEAITVIKNMKSIPKFGVIVEPFYAKN